MQYVSRMRRSTFTKTLWKSSKEILRAQEFRKRPALGMLWLALGEPNLISYIMSHSVHFYLFVASL